MEMEMTAAGMGTESENFEGTGWGWGRKCVPAQLSTSNCLPSFLLSGLQLLLFCDRYCCF